jgi:tRNA A37 threonylcarbamoyladenosine dehydratase
MSVKIVKPNWKERTEMLIGAAAIEKLKCAHAAVFGLGGVGGFAVEALCRAGVGTLTIVDGDEIAETNLNRQIIATIDSIGQQKTEVMKNRILSINPEAVVFPHHCFVLPGEMMAQFDFTAYDYVIDAIDTVTTKIELIVQAIKANTPIISSMGTGNKLNPELLTVTDIFATSVCPLAKVMRKELRARGIEKLDVVYSQEEPLCPTFTPAYEERRSTPGSISFVPPAAGLLLASTVIKNIISDEKKS